MPYKPGDLHTQMEKGACPNTFSFTLPGLHTLHCGYSLVGDLDGEEREFFMVPISRWKEFWGGGEGV